MKISIFDIETLLECFLVCIYNPVTNEWHDFSINKNVDDGYKMIKFLNTMETDYNVGFNNVNFDGQVLEYIIRNYHKWNDLTNLQICHKIWQYAQDLIDNMNAGRFPPYREEHLNNRQIDLFRIHHFDNEAKRTSLKWLEFMMDLENIQDMPIAHDATGLTDEDLDSIIGYCHNDVIATYKFYLYTIGQVEDHWPSAHLYKGKNKIQDRLDLIEEFKFPSAAINWSDVRIGDEINLRGYSELTGKDRNEVYKLKLNRKPTRKITFGDCIPDYVTFETEEFKKFYDDIRKVKVNYLEKQEFPFTYNGTNYKIAKGGIHSAEKKRAVIAEEDEYLEDADVGSQYPNAIVKRKLFPSHLGKPWLVNYERTIERRMDYKARGKKDSKYAGLADSFKLALNGGGFGKTNENTSWQYDPVVTFFCTIGNQFEILMLIERLEMAGIHCVSANTDGIVCKFKKDLNDKYVEICKWWENTVGNNVMGMLEYALFKAIYQTSVNSYIAIKEDGSVKKKGQFMTDFEFNKNKSGRIIPLALEAYYKDGTPPEEFIKNHNYIFDFCMGVKNSRKYYFQAGNIIYTDKVIRYIITKKGEVLTKVKKPEYHWDTGNDVSHCEAPDPVTGKQPLVTVCNRIDPSIPVSEYGIDYDYYLKEVNAIIESIKRQGSKKKIYNNPNQLNLF